ncbi:MAG: hypothetical protein KGZ58_03205 [Ignavibacteriales bacterium]|nr:hypothetical protein [Ignavibacteriales bacterium]
MNIHNVETNNRIHTQEPIDSSLRFGQTKKQDVAMISREAQSHYHTNRKINIERIQVRINEDWYFRRDVTEKIANAMLLSGAV